MVIQYNYDDLYRQTGAEQTSAIKATYDYDFDRELLWLQPAQPAHIPKGRCATATESGYNSFSSISRRKSRQKGGGNCATGG